MKNITPLVIALVFWAIPSTVIGQNIVINEIMASNTTSIQDENSSHEDWIEIYNKSASSVNLAGYGLSDDGLLLYKWTFPNVSLGSHQYMIIWASDKNRSVASSPLHTNFKISGSGETIYLTNAANTFTDSSPAAALQPNISYGRLPNATGPFVYFATATPNAVNSGTGYSGNLDPPAFSQNAGFYPSSISLTLSSLESGTTILYTLDGSEPNENNLSGTTYTYKNVYIENPGQTSGPLLNNSYQTLQYAAPITISDRSSQPNDLASMSSTFSHNPTYIPSSPIFKSTTVRAKVIKPGYLPSAIITKNYFITPLGSGKYSFPIVSLNLNEDRLFGYDNGIFVAGKDFDLWRAANPNGTAKASKRGNYYLEVNDERAGNFSYFVNGTEVINQDVGLKVRGGVSRRFQNKSLSIFARSDYGDDDMDYNFFSNLSYNAYERLTLSNSGGDFTSTMFRDAFLHDLCKELYPEKEAYQPTITFVNGEYWGIMNLRERYDDNYFKRVYNTTAIDFLENEADVKEGDRTHYNAMINYLNSNSMAVQANYDYIKTQIDPENVIDYFAANIFFQNEDWPNNNMLFWRNKIAAYNPAAPANLDGRWRYVFHDMDNSLSFVFGDYTSNSLAIATSVETGPNYLNPEWSTVVLRKLLVNTSFKNDFINRFADLLNTSFLSSRTLQRLDEMAAVVRPEIAGQATRWKSPASVNSFNSDIEYEEEFLSERPTHQRSHIRSVFSIASNINATLDVSNTAQGYIKMNTINIAVGTPGITSNPYPWTGIYFRNIPVKLKAIAKPGYIFTNWSGASSSTDAEITITPSANFSITAHFAIDTTTETSVPMYFWMMNGSITNGAQLTSLNSTYELATDGTIQYQSCFAGYPYASGNPNYGKASMERRNNPTSINYRQSVNGNLPFASSDMRGLQIKQPFQSGGLENTMVFNFSTAGYKKIIFSFAAVNENAASGISVEYSVNSGTPVWLTTGLASPSLALTSAYQLFTVDFTSISAASNNPNFKIRLRFTGANMTADLGNRVTFNNIVVDGVKLPLYYTSPNMFTVGTTIANLTPTTSETITGYSISPALPTGLSFSTSTGVISGTPTAVAASATHTVTATYASGTLTYGVIIGVNSAAPSGLSYTSPNVFTVNTAITPLNPTIGGGAVLNYSVVPALPAGLTLNVLSGVISGTPTAVAGTASYLITASNSGGSTNFNIDITVNGAAPSGLSYTTPHVYTKNTVISNLNPTVTGTVDSYSVLPALPTGLSLDTTTGVISGTPTALTTIATYTVTATNAYGSTSFGIVITVNDMAPNGLSYTTPNVYTKNTAIANLNPTVSGGAVVSYSISPALSSGLSFNTTTGVISGTPTVIKALTTYTITATNSGGSTSFQINITVNDMAPSGLSYATPNVFTRNTAIPNLNPTTSGGAVVSYSIAPALSAGLIFNTSTGRISGTPTAIRVLTTYTVTATNTGGSTTFDVDITVNDIAPSGLSYNTPNVFTRNTAISNMNPTISGGPVTSYSITPALSAGLSFNTSTGRISGTPIVIQPLTTYTITATNSGGSVAFDVNITVNDIAPSGLSYTSPNTFTKNSTISNLDPSVSGGAIVSYSIAPVLPAGLSFNTSTGRISGTPTAVTAMATYTVTATNSGGFTTFGVVITVNDIAPNSLSYSSPNVFVKNNAISNLDPTVSGGAVISYSIAPGLPTGLSFNTATGRISGTPVVVAATATYTVTATNSGGFTNFGIVITVNDVAPSGLSYSTPNVFTRNTAIPNLNPTVSGGSVVSYSIAPALSAGLNFNTSTGRISGTPTALRSLTTYTVTAVNSGGSVAFDVDITVNDIAPSSLSYTSPNVFTKNNAISNLDPTVSGGTVVSYNITPSLPTGLVFDTVTGVISGTPTAVAATATYTVTATNSGGFITFDVVITVNDVAPGSLNYNSPNTFTKNSVITNLNPTVSGVILSYSIAPNLPTGLAFDTATGVISGTPTAVSPMATYTVTANNSGGSATFGVVITVNDVEPSGLSYSTPNVFTRNTAIPNLNPTVSGGIVVSYSIAPALSAGLNFNTSTGRISGTPTAIRALTTYTVTAVNSGGSTTFDVDITVNDIAPNALSYASPNTFTKNSTILDLDPTVSGGPIVSYSVAPGLPSGLDFNTSTGRISGTPTAVTAMATYTVTATNSGGFTSFGVVITVNDVAPGSLGYNSPNVFIKNSVIANLNPTVSGVILSYSIAPNLPAGLAFDTATGVISGTPTAVSPMATYTVTANNSGGSATFGVVITVNDIAPSGLGYTTPNVFTKNSTITNLNPSVSGGTVINYTITPPLPAGLSFNTSTGVISGIPTVLTASSAYTVTAFNSGGSTSFDVSITVNDIAPNSLTYPTPNVFTKDIAISNLSPSVLGGAVVSYSITPALSAGLLFNTATGVISGIPTTIEDLITYTVTATNTGGSTSFNVNITVNDVAPSGLSYPSPNVFTKGTTITNLNPTVSGGAVTDYAIVPALPQGLSFDTETGVISGTPTVIAPTGIYTVTAADSGGSVTFDITITVNDIAPNTLSYNSPNVFTKNTAIANLNPTVSGGAVVNYSITPTLPNGLSFNTSTGVISGTPTIIAPMGTYWVTASNSGGFTTFGVVITVNDIAPSGLSYTSPNVFTRNTPIANLNPTVSGGAVLSYSITPALSAGLSFNTSTGIISGIPTVIQAETTYTVNAINSGGSVSFDVDITVNDIAPNALSYNSPNVFTKNTAIGNLNPTVSGGAVVSYSITPALSAGLSFNTATGVISGTPTVIQSLTSYTVTAENSGGLVSFDVDITVNDIAPNTLSYTTPNVFIKNTTVVNLNPTISGGAVVSYSITPALSAGLSFNAATGVISGTPTVIQSLTSYTVTASNSGGSVSFDVDITVNDIAPNALSYNSPNVFTKGTTISSLFPSIAGTVISYTIAPALPSGLNFNTATGEISGTPTMISPMADYTVTASNSGGTTTFDIRITVNDEAPNALSYNSPNIFTKGSMISDLNPTISGGVVLEYSIAPALPAGLSFDTATGQISGTPTVISNIATYIVTATNSGGSISFGVVITVNDLAPAALSYTSPNVFTNGTTIPALIPTVTGGTVIGYDIVPALPAGLSFDSTTGIISGTPTGTAAAATYTVTATNSGGSVSFDVVIAINDVAPSALSYASPNVFTTGVSMGSLLPTVTGTVISYSINPTLPTGLSFNTLTGEITGTPNGIFATGIYTVTAVNSGGTTTFDIEITVNDVAPSALSYSSPNIFIIGTPITSLIPSVAGNVIGFSVSPALPAGLSIDSATGAITGTPSGVISSGLYTVTAINSGGSTTFDIDITIDEFMANPENDFANISVYPNPFDTVLHIDSGIDTISYTLYSIDGKLIQQNQLRNSQIEVRDLPSGVYLLQLNSEDKVKRLKVIKR